MSDLKQILECIDRDIKASEDKTAELVAHKKYLLDKFGDGSEFVSENGAVGAHLVRDASFSMTQVEAAEKVLRETGKAMTAAQIVDEILRRRYYPAGAQENSLKNSILSIMLKKPEIFQKIRRGLWALKKDGSRMRLADIVKEFMSASPDQEFTTSMFLGAVKQKGRPTSRDTMKSVLTRLKDQGFLEIVVKGKGARESVFKKKS